MKRFLVGTVLGLFIGWVTVPIVKASFGIENSDKTYTTIPYMPDNDEDRVPHSYKEYLTQMLQHMVSIDKKLSDLNDTMRAIKEKLKA